MKEDKRREVRAPSFILKNKMEKTLLFLIVLLTIPSIMKSQDINKETTNPEWNDYVISIDTKNKVYGIRAGIGNNSNTGYGVFNFSLGLGEYGSVAAAWGYGIHGVADNDSFIFEGAIFPYIGYGSQQTPKYNEKTKKIDKEFKGEFLWGAAANISAGVKIFTTAKGNPHYLTVGYYISAPKLETKGMFDHGSWCFGITAKI